MVKFLLHTLERRPACGGRWWLRLIALIGRWRGHVNGRQNRRRHFIVTDRKCHALAIFTSVDGHHAVDRHHDVTGFAAETGFELNEVIAQLQRTGGVHADVEHDLPALHIFTRHLDRVVNLDGDIGREPIFGTPVVQRPNQIGTCGRQFGRTDHGELRSGLLAFRLSQFH